MLRLRAMLGRPETMLLNLEIIERAGPRGVTCAAFARAKWAGRKGSHLNCAAGTVLAHMWRAGLLRQWGHGSGARYVLSPSGNQLLRQIELEIARAPVATEWGPR